MRRPRATFRASRKIRFFLLLLGLTAVSILTAGAEEPSPQSREIADIERQISILNKKLTELKASESAVVTKTTTPKIEGTLDPDWVKALNWRCIGPAGMGGRITGISVFEADPSTYWIATASGGLAKTVNNGTTFEHQFDKENTVSVGDVAVAPSDRNIVWVGTGENNPRNSVSYGDGVYKSTDSGKTWKNMGLRKTYQIGKIVIHPKDPNIVYVGALGRCWGPNNERGLYKTTNGGQTWERILFVDDKTGVIDMRMSPADPETLVVAMWERQRDGFDTHRGEPALVDGYDAYDPIKKWGPGSGIYKTTDGGKSFKKLTKGLPTNPMGRVGLDYYAKDPKTLFAIIDCEKIGMGTSPRQQAPGANDGYMGIIGESVAGGARLSQVTSGSPADKAGLKEGDVVTSVDAKTIANYGELLDKIRGRKPGEKLAIKVRRDNETKDVPVVLGTRPAEQEQGGGGRGGQGLGSATRPNGGMYGGQRENVQDTQGPGGHEYGGVYKSTDGGESWTRVNSINPRPMYFSQVRVDPSNDKYVYVLGVSLYRSVDGGKTFKADGNRGVHPDQHALWIDPKDGRHMIVGTDGGFYATYDRMEHWDHLNVLALAQFYHVSIDNKKPYYCYGGLQDNGTWGGPSISLKGNGPINEDWISVSGGDGFVTRVDPNDPDLVYYESQDGNMGRRNLKTGERGSIRPRGDIAMQVLTNASLVPNINSFSVPFTPRGMFGQARTMYRFNWNTPFILSAHNSKIFYAAGNHVFRSVKQGDELKVISPEIARTKRGTGTALAESPRNADLLYVGTDDGYVWVTRDGGAKWTNITNNIPLPGPRWVSSIEPSRFSESRCYVCFDAHRSDDDEPYLFVTEDYGQTWKPIRANLPVGSTRVLREDIANPNLLYCGTEFSAFASLNRGASWTKINNNLPTVAVHEFAIHPTAGEMVAATHGRSLWIVDVTPLRQMTVEAMKEKAHLYEPAPAVRYRAEPGSGSIYGNGSRRFFGQNAPTGSQIFYSLTKKAETANLKVIDYAGKTVRELEVKKDPGLHVVTWDLRGGQQQRANRGEGEGRGGAGAAVGQSQGGGRGGTGGGRGGAATQGGGRGGQRTTQVEGQAPRPPQTAGGGAATQPPAQSETPPSTTLEAQQAPQGPRGGFGGFRPGVPAGYYRIVLTVDGQEYSSSVKVEGDAPMGGFFAAGDKEEEQEKEREEEGKRDRIEY